MVNFEPPGRPYYGQVAGGAIAEQKDTRKRHKELTKEKVNALREKMNRIM